MMISRLFFFYFQMSMDDMSLLSVDKLLSTSVNQPSDMVVENFFGCYLLNSLNPRCKGQTYIGFTVDLNRRIKQHNKGKEFGGAKKTSGKGPWLVVQINEHCIEKRRSV